MYAVLQEDEVIDYFRDKDSAEAEAFNQFERGNTFRTLCCPDHHRLRR
jgi:hypothetical protein